jgi:hypothetical protein
MSIGLSNPNRAHLAHGSDGAVIPAWKMPNCGKADARCFATWGAPAPPLMGGSPTPDNYAACMKAYQCDPGSASNTKRCADLSEAYVATASYDNVSNGSRDYATYMGGPDVDCAGAAYAGCATNCSAPSACGPFASANAACVVPPSGPGIDPPPESTNGSAFA